MISHRKYITRNLSCQINVLFPYHMWLQYTIDKRLMTTRYHDNIINKFLTLKIYPSNNNNIKWDIRVNHIFIFRYVNINYIWLLSTIIIEMYRCGQKCQQTNLFNVTGNENETKYILKSTRTNLPLGSSI